VDSLHGGFASKLSGVHQSGSSPQAIRAQRRSRTLAALVSLLPGD
jgi:hypothetical protein